MHCVKLPGQRLVARDFDRQVAEFKVRVAKLVRQRLLARDFDRQVAEFQVRAAVLNGFTSLGIPVTKAVG